MSLTKFAVDDGPHNMDGYGFSPGTEQNGSKRSSAAR